jgi:hypothetical protein
MPALATDKQIELTQGKTAIVSAEDFEYINQWKWSYDGHNHCAVRSETIKKDGKYRSKSILMHKLIMETPSGMNTDHINGDRLDNRKSNLRICTHKENQRNMKMHKDNTSGYKGVSRSREGRWVVKIGNKYIATFKDIVEAAKRYNVEAKARYGEYAKLNNIGGE